MSLLLTEHFQQVDWMGMHLELPVDWEIAGHSAHEPRGRLVFVDRRNQRLLLSWAKAPRPPDPKRLMKDYRSRELTDNPDCGFKNLPGGTGWYGYRRLDGEGSLSRAGMYDRERSRWMEITICWPGDTYDHALEEQLLRRFNSTPPDTGVTRWQAFDLDCRVPSEWALNYATVKPADVKLSFQNGKSEVWIRRIGMADAWYRGDLEAFLRKETGIGHRRTRVEFTECRRNGLRALKIRGFEEGIRLKKVLGLLRIREDEAWAVPEKNSVMLVTTFSHSKNPLPSTTMEVE